HRGACAHGLEQLVPRLADAVGVAIDQLLREERPNALHVTAHPCLEAGTLSGLETGEQVLGSGQALAASERRKRHRKQGQESARTHRRLSPGMGARDDSMDQDLTASLSERWEGRHEAGIIRTAR